MVSVRALRHLVATAGRSRRIAMPLPAIHA
jgi:hypothetical protein